MDLDKWNVREFNGTEEELNELYKLDEPILIFDTIPMKNLTQVHVRGSSKKETIDFNYKLVILLLFEDDLYMYIQLNES